MTFLVEVAIDVSAGLSIALGGYDWCHPFGFDPRNDAVCVVSVVGDKVLSLGLRDKRLGLRGIVDIASGEVDMQWITEPVHQSVDFGGKAAARAPTTLRLGPPFPPPESWWALA